MHDFEIIPWINFFFSPLLHHFSPQLFPAHHVGNLPVTGVTGLQVFLVLPDEVSLNASSPSLRSWPWGKPSPTQDGLPEIFFFLTNFHQKKPKEWWFSLFLREHLRQHIRIFLGPVFFLFGIGQSDLSCKVDTVRGKDYWWKSSQFTEALYCKVMDQAFCDCKHQQAWTLLLVAQQTSWAGCLPRL